MAIIINHSANPFTHPFQPTLGVASSDSALLYAILCPVGDYFKANTNGAVSLLADPAYTRAWPGGCGDRKMGSNYAPTIHVQRVASQRGLQQVLWLYGEDHQLTEVGTMNIFVYFVNDRGERELRTPPLNGLILPGITRDSILQLARQWGKFRVSEEPFTMADITRLVKEERVSLCEVRDCYVSPNANAITPMAAGAATGAVWLGHRVRGESDRAHPVLGRGHLYSDHAAGAAGVRGDAHRNVGHPVRQEGASVGGGHRIVLVIIIYILQIFDMCILLLYEKEREREKRSQYYLRFDLFCNPHTIFFL